MNWRLEIEIDWKWFDKYGIDNRNRNKFQNGNIYGSDIDRVESKMMPRLRAEETEETDMSADICKIGWVILDSCLGRPIRRNSVLDWLRARRLEDIQVEILDIVSWRWEMLAGKLKVENGI